MSNSRTLEDLSPFFRIEFPTTKEIVGFTLSLRYTHFRTTASMLNPSPWSTSTKIAPNLLLTKVPEKGEPDLFCQQVKREKGSFDITKLEGLNLDQETIARFKERLRNESGKIGVIIGAVKHHELAYENIASILEWENKKIKHFLLPMTDNTADAGDKNIREAVWEIYNCIQEGNTALVHCKAGRGRSLMVCVIYLCVFEFPNLSVEEVEDYVRKFRAQVEMHDVQREAATRIVHQMREEIKNKDQNQNSNSINDKREPVNIPAYLSSNKLETTLTQFMSAKLLAIFACKQNGSIWTASISEKVKQFFLNISTNENWYPTLANEIYNNTDADNNNTNLNNNVNAEASLDEATKEFERLRLNFFNEVTEHIAQICNRSFDEVLAEVRKLKLSPKIHKAHSNLTQFCHRSSSDLSPHSEQSPLIGMGKFSTSPPKPSVLQSPAELSDEPTSEAISTSPSLSRRQPSQS